ncbi:hypothetical protein [Enterocloster clostridioformis]|uniref:hypothetical protein n=2 Tax=Enterocloster clostridioformis TaxID=1531 RepID=UPI001A9A4642|nr:hypothetical protein [Enterocloster clostridioformis]MCA5578868.1 hypothetical protein [Enterocloster clostridioformis]
MGTLMECSRNQRGCALPGAFLYLFTRRLGDAGEADALAQAHKNHEFGKRGETDGRLV